MQILSWAPRIVVFPAFVDKARCDHVIALAEKGIHPSDLAYAPGALRGGDNTACRSLQSRLHPTPQPRLEGLITLPPTLNLRPASRPQPADADQQGHLFVPLYGP